MNFLGLTITRKKGYAVPSSAYSGGSFFGVIRESFSGAFQSNVTTDTPKNILAFSAVYACVTVIASDIAKLNVNLKMEDQNGISREAKGNSPFLPVLTKPNKYQTWFKFVEQWMVSKLLYGNAYILKQRDARNIVTGLYVLDAMRVMPLVADNGDIYYKLSVDLLSNVMETVTVPQSEIMHDTMVCLWHPLVGVSPIYACGMSATMGNRIQKNSTKFFDNMSRPSGHLTAPGTISDETANRLKRQWEENFGGDNIGRLAVLGDGLKYEPITIPAEAAQLIEQLKWTVEDVARCFHVPLWKIGGPEPSRTNLESLQQTYYSDCLQALIESAEDLLDDGLSLPARYCVEFDLSGLMRMDTAARYKALNDAVSGGWMSPNEARADENLAPVPGGESPYLQQQNYSLAALSKRDSQPDPFALARSTRPIPDDAALLEKPEKPDDDDEENEDKKAVAELIEKLQGETIAKAKAEKDAADMKAFAELFIKSMEVEYATA